MASSADNTHRYGGLSASTSTTRPRPQFERSASLAKDGASPRSPRTPLLGRSISSQFGSPGSFTREQEDHVIYELGSRHLSAGFAGESRPRCIYRFKSEHDKRPGDYRHFDPAYAKTRRKRLRQEGAEVGEWDPRWSEKLELYSVNVGDVGLQLVADRLTRAVRQIHANFLQLDNKLRKAVLVLPSLLPVPLVNVTLQVLFEHHAQPPSIQVLTTPIMAVVGAGVRCALVVDLGWEESVVSAVGEYKTVAEARSIRAGKWLVHETAKMLEVETKGIVDVHPEEAEEVVERLTWVRPKLNLESNVEEEDTVVKLPFPGSGGASSLFLPFSRLSDPTECALFPAKSSGNAPEASADRFDDHDLPLHNLVFNVLLSLHVDLRAVCMSRIIITGGGSQIPGLKRRLLQEVQSLLDIRGWDSVNTYGSATPKHNRVLQERSANIARLRSKRAEPALDSTSPMENRNKPLSETELAEIPPGERPHDDLFDSVSAKAERQARKVTLLKAKGEAELSGVVRGVNTLGAWAGASLVASMRVKGVHEVEREEFLKQGWKDSGILI